MLNIDNRLKTEIDKDSPVPLYYQIKKNIKDSIENKEYKPGELIPSERELCELFNVSRTTIRQAIDELVNDGLVEKSKGKGTYVANPGFNYGTLKDIFKNNFYYDALKKRGYIPKTEILRQKIVNPGKKISVKLDLIENEKIIDIERVRYIEDEPIVIINNHIPYRLCPGLEKIDLENKSLYKIIEDEFNIRSSKSKISFYPGLADEFESEILHQKKGDPLQIIETVSCSDADQYFDYFTLKFRGNYGKITLEI